MHYRPATLADADAIRLFLMRMGWGGRVADQARFRTLLANSDRTITVWEGERLVGFARALCDEAANGYISMVAVDPAFHGHGVGSQMLHHLMADSEHITWLLRAGRDSQEFWHQLGFRPSEIAMERQRLR